MRLNRSIVLAALAVGALALLAVPLSAAGNKAEGKRDLDAVLASQRLRQLTAELTLTDRQKEKVQPLITEEVKYYHRLREDQTMGDAEKMKKERAFREAAKPKFKAILSEEQFAKWEKLHEKKPGKPKAE